MLTDLRVEIAEALDAAGIKAVEYIGETITPPCAVVVPGQPYLVWPTRSNGVPFGSVQVNVDVLLLVTESTAAKSAASRIDDLVVNAVETLDDREQYDVVSATRPGVVTLRGAKYVGASLSMQKLQKITTPEEP